MTEETHGAETEVEGVDVSVDENTEVEANNTDNLAEDSEEHNQEVVANEDSSGEGVSESKEEPDWLKKRIDKEVAKRKRLEEELAAIRKKESEAAYQHFESIDPSTGEYLVRPDPGNYEDWREYEADRASYEQKAYKAREVAKQRMQEADQYEQLYKKLEQNKELARKKYEDFDDVEEIVNNQNFPISEAMAGTILSSDMSGDLLYWLGKNPQEAQRLYSLPPIIAAREIGKIESQFAQPRKIASSAPKPIKVEKKSDNVGFNYETANIDDMKKFLNLF